MKNVLTIILTLIYFNSFCQKGQILIDTIKWDNGNVKQIRKYMDSDKYEDKKDLNNRHGNWLYYYETGELEQSRYYKNGSQDSIITDYYKSGNKKKEGFLNPDRGRIWTSWFENGKKESVGTYDGGYKVDKWSYWDSTGYLNSEIEYHDSIYYSTFYTYFQNGQVETIKKYKGPYHLIAEVKFDINFKESDGDYIMYDFSGDYKHYPMGDWDTFDEKGILTHKISFAH